MQRGEEAPSSTANNVNLATPLDPKGDVVLRCRKESTGASATFLVSTHILRLASPVFSSMFSATFREGQRLLAEDCPVVELEDDDPELVGLMLRVLHYQGSSADHKMDAETLARLSHHCDKYDCTRALRPWVQIWLKNVATKDESAKAMGFQILAAFIFDDTLEFRRKSRTATLQLEPSFVAAWEEEELFEPLLSSVTGKARAPFNEPVVTETIQHPWRSACSGCWTNSRP
ncbi:hypothetical protein AA0121_g13445 [Alternaria tenuissima]|nr:hypothetical protein AA0121_g13445 [Alternaria tenuissima]